MSCPFQKVHFILGLFLSAHISGNGPSPLLPAARAQQGLPTSGTGEVRDFTLPERNKEGILIWQLNGKHAKLRPDGKMEITQLAVSTFRKTAVEWTLSTPACVLNRESREAISESPVQIVDKDTKITGVGFHWLANESRFIIRAQAKVVLKESLSKSSALEAVAPSPINRATPTHGPTVIDADTLNFDYEKRVATFEGDVKAVDPQLTVKCKKMFVHFSDKNSEVSRIEGLGDVHLFHEGKEAVSEKAVFTRETGTVVLTEGDPRLKDEKGNWIKGSSIIYNTLIRIMKVEKPRLEFAPSSGGNMLDLQRSELPSSGGLVFCGSDMNIFGQKQSSKIDADFLTHHFEKHTALFEGNVHVVDSQLELKCKKMIVYFSEKDNEVTRVEGFGDVRILQKGKEALGEKAVFTRETGVLVLTEGNPQMKDEKGNWVKGNLIIYNARTKMMRVEGSKVEFKPSGGEK